MDCSDHFFNRRGRLRKGLRFGSPTTIVGVTIHSNSASIAASHGVTCVIVFAPVTKVGYLGAIGAGGLCGTGIVLFLGRIQFFTRVAPGTAVDAAAGVTALRLFAPMTGIRTRAILAGRQIAARTGSYSCAILMTGMENIDAFGAIPKPTSQ